MRDKDLTEFTIRVYDNNDTLLGFASRADFDHYYFAAINEDYDDEDESSFDHDVSWDSIETWNSERLAKYKTITY